MRHIGVRTFKAVLPTCPVSLSAEALTQCDVDSSRCCSLRPRRSTRRSPSCKVTAEITTCRPPWPRRRESGLSSGRHSGASPPPGTLCCSDRGAETLFQRNQNCSVSPSLLGHWTLRNSSNSPCNYLGTVFRTLSLPELLSASWTAQAAVRFFCFSFCCFVKMQ